MPLVSHSSEFDGKIPLILGSNYNRNNLDPVYETRFLVVLLNPDVNIYILTLIKYTFSSSGVAKITMHL